MANETAEQAILNKLAQAPSFHPAGAKLFVPDWTLDPGDVVTVTAKDNVNDPDETPTSYNVPIYSMNLTWNGASRVEIESTGNQQREPLSALRRKEYQTGRRGYGAAKQIEEQTQQQYKHYVDQTDAYRKEIYRVNGVVYDSAGNIVYQTDPITGEYILDNAGNKIPVYNPESNGSISGQVIQSAQRMATIIKQSGTVYEVFSETKQYYEGDRVLYPDSNGNPYKFINDHNPGPWKGDGEHGDVVSLGTLQSQIDNNTDNFNVFYGEVNERLGTIEGSQLWGDADELIAINGKMRVDGNKLIIEEGGGLYTERTVSGRKVQSGIWDAGNLTAGMIVQTINGTTETTIRADKVNLEGYVTASYVDTAVLLADSLTSDTGYIGNIKASNINTGGNINADGAVYGTGIYIKRSSQSESGESVTSYIDLSTAVKTIQKNPDTAEGEIGIRFNTLGNSSTWIPINFNIADTAYYKSHVGISTVAAAGWTNDGEGGGYYNTVTATAKDSTQQNPDTMDVNVVLPTITVRPDLGTNASGTVKAYGPVVDGSDYQVSTAATLYLKADGNYCYITSNNSTPTAENIVAQINNPGGGGGGEEDYNRGYADGQSNADAIIDTISHPAGDILYQASKLNIDIYANPYLNLTDQDGILHPISKTGVTETIQIPVVVTNSVLDKGNISKTNDYTGSYTITGGGGNVNLDGSIGTNIPVGVTDLPLSLALGTPSTDLGTTGTARWSDENHNYVYSVNSSLTVDGTGNVLTRTVSGLILNPEKAIEYGQSTVSAILTGATAPSGTTPQTLATGTYGLYLTKNNTQDSNPIVYYRVTTGGTVNYVVSSNGDTVMAWNGLTLVGSIYPNTDVTLGSTDQLGRRQVSYNGKSGYVSTSNISTVKGSTNYPGRIGWVDDESDPDTRTVYSLAKVVLAATDTGESTHSVQVEYTDGTIVPNGAEVTVDASAISGGGPSYNIQHNRAITYSANGNFTLKPSSGYDAMSQVAVTVNVPSGTTTQRTATGLDDTIVLPASHTGTATITGNIVLYDDDSESSNFPVRINASNVFEAGRAAGANLQTNRTVTYTTNGTKALTPSSGYDGMEKATITINVPQSSASLGSRSFTSNGTYSANDFGYDGFSSVTVNVSTSHNITAGTPVARTGSTGSRVYMGSIAASRLAANMWISVPISCGGTSKTFYISIT